MASRPSAKRRRTPSRASGGSAAGKHAQHLLKLALRPAKTAKTTPDTTLDAELTSFNRALRFLGTLANFESRRIVRYTPENFNLDRMRTLLRHLKNPQTRFPSIHVAGTKGKGSSCAMAAAMLRAAGYRVGLYSSPHLLDVRERIRILEPGQDRKTLPQGQMIPHGQFGRLARRLEPLVASARYKPSHFDVLTAIAFLWFAEQEVDIAVIETGLGGRLDSTNVLKPLVSAITSVSLDHTRQLGSTTARIAAEKAGIFKPGAGALSAPQEPEVEAVLRRAAQQCGTNLLTLGTEIDFSTRFEASRMLGRHNRICFNTDQMSFDHLAVPLLGEHQAHNCGLALAMLDQLKRRGFERISAETCAAGLAGLRLEGRMEVLRENPTVVVDGAHNAASVEAMLRALGQHFSYDSTVVIFGCCSDKDIGGMLGRLVAGADKIIFTRVDSVRSAEPRELAQQYTERFGKMAQVGQNLSEALQIAKRAATGDDLICITGSFYLIGEAKKLFAERAGRPSQQVTARHKPRAAARYAS